MLVFLSTRSDVFAVVGVLVALAICYGFGMWVIGRGVAEAIRRREEDR